MEHLEEEDENQENYVRHRYALGGKMDPRDLHDIREEMRRVHNSEKFKHGFGGAITHRVN